MSGERCRKPPIPGGSVCHVHGGNAPQVRAAASRRLRDLVDPAITRLAEALDAGDARIRLQAVREVLTRAGGEGLFRGLEAHLPILAADVRLPSFATSTGPVQVADLHACVARATIQESRVNAMTMGRIVGLERWVRARFPSV